MADSKILGKNFVFSIKSGTTWIPCGFEESSTVEIVSKVVDTTNKNDGNWESSQQIRNGWKVSGSFYATDEAAASQTVKNLGTIQAAMLGVTQLHVRFEDAGNPGVYYEGLIWLDSLKIVADNKDMVKADYSGTGNGPLTLIAGS